MTRHHSSLLFLLTGEGRGGGAATSRVYSHDWLDRRRTAFYTQTGAGRRVVKLVLHQVQPRLSGQLRCQIIMQLTGKDSQVLVPAVRSQRITVVERPQVEAEVRLVEAGPGVECSAPGYPAPQLSWHLLQDSQHLSPVSEDAVETLPLLVQSDSGLQVSRERLYRLEEGEFVCLVETRDGQLAHRMSVGANLSWEYAGILEQPDQTVESDVLQHQTEDQLHQQHQELIIAVTCLSISLASLSLIASCLCWRSCRRRSNTPISFQNNRTLALGESSHLISSHLLEVKYLFSDDIAGQHRTTISTRNSMKRKAPRPGIGEEGTAFL